MTRWRGALLGIIMIISLLGGFWGHDPISPEIGIVSPDYWWNQIPVFFALFGFCGSLLILFFAKALGKFLLQKKEGYYDAG